MIDYKYDPDPKQDLLAVMKNLEGGFYREAYRRLVAIMDALKAAK